MSSSLPLTLGIDPGTRVTGYGVICGESGRALDYGSIQPPSSKRLSERYAIIYRGVAALIEKFQPTAVSVETQYVAKNVQSAIKLGMARGMVILAATEKGIPVFEYTPSKAKSAVVGNGRASKEQVQVMIAQLLGLPELPQPEDAADALALAYCHIASARSPLSAGKQV